MTEEEYIEIKIKVDTGKEKIDEVSGWLNPRYKHWVEKYNLLAVQLLEYETENNLLPI